MPRPKYPSDAARKQRPHAKVHLSWMHHPKYAAAFADPETRGIIVGLWVFAVQAHASSTDDTVTLTRGAVAAISGRTQRGSALNSLRTACELMGYPVGVDGECVSIRIRNLSKKQGFTPHDVAESPQTPAPSYSEEPKNRRTEEPIKDIEPPATPSAVPRARAIAKAKRPMPDVLEPAEREALRAWCAKAGFNEHQLKHAVQVVRDWASSNGKLKHSWVATIRNAMRDGWALKGYRTPHGSYVAPSSPGWDDTVKREAVA